MVIVEFHEVSSQVQFAFVREPTNIMNYQS